MLPITANRKDSRNLRQEVAAFSILELMAVVSIVTVIAALLLPALQKTKARSQTIYCLNNLKQLQVAWDFYAGDNEDQLVPNNSAPGLHWIKASASLVFTSKDLTNKLFLTDTKNAAFARYIKNADVYRCPSDDSVTTIGNNSHVPRVRSYTLNGVLGDDPQLSGSVNRLSDVVSPAPARRFVFVDTHPGWSGPDYFSPPKPQGQISHEFNSVPSGLHNRAGTLSFADGHAEIHRWQDPRTLSPTINYPPTQLGLILLPMTSPNNSDIAWLSDRGASR